MLFTLGVGSASGLIGCIISVVCDNFPHWARWKVCGGICAAGFLVGLIYVTPVRMTQYKSYDNSVFM